MADMGHRSICSLWFMTCVEISFLVDCDEKFLIGCLGFNIFMGIVRFLDLEKFRLLKVCSIKCFKISCLLQKHMLLISHTTKRTFNLSINFLSTNLNFIQIKLFIYYWIFRRFQGYNRQTNKPMIKIVHYNTLNDFIK